jgi:hypothetical protein
VDQAKEMQDTVGVECTESRLAIGGASSRKMADGEYLDNEDIQMGNREVGRNSRRLRQKVRGIVFPKLLKIIPKLRKIIF